MQRRDIIKGSFYTFLSMFSLNSFAENENILDKKVENNKLFELNLNTISHQFDLKDVSAVYIGVQDADPRIVTNQQDVLEMSSASPVEQPISFNDHSTTVTKFNIGTRNISLLAINNDGIPLVFLPNINLSNPKALQEKSIGPQTSSTKRITSCSTIDFLRILEPAYPNQVILVHEHAYQSNIGGGNFWYDVEDNTSSDDGGTVIVTTGGHRWKRSEVASLTFEMFGAYGNGAKDDTLAISNCINTAVRTKKSIKSNNATYLLSKRGEQVIPWSKRMLGYAIFVSKAVFLELDLSLSTFLVNHADSNNQSFSAFFFDGCSNINITSFRCVNLGSGFFTSINWRETANAVTLNSCFNSEVSNVIGLNLRGVVQAFSCDSIKIIDCEGSGPAGSYRFASFGLYNSDNSFLIRCKNYQGTRDGDIGLYGTCNNCHIISCEAYNFEPSDKPLRDQSKINLGFRGAQGIFVDAGMRGCTVSQCITYGYHVGIDVKTGAHNTYVSGNIIYVGIIGIASRFGEAKQPTYSNVVTNNTLLFPPIDEGFLSKSPQDKVGNLEIKRIGILLDEAIGITVSNNNFAAVNIGYNSFLAENIAFIHGDFTHSKPNTFGGAITISNNNFVFENIQGPMSNAVNGVAISLKYFGNIYVKENIYTVPRSLNSKFNLSPLVNLSTPGLVSIAGEGFNDITNKTSNYAYKIYETKKVLLNNIVWSTSLGFMALTDCESVVIDNLDMKAYARINNSSFVNLTGVSTCIFKNCIFEVTDTEQILIKTIGGKLAIVNSIYNFDFNSHINFDNKEAILLQNNVKLTDN